MNEVSLEQLINKNLQNNDDNLMNEDFFKDENDINQLDHFHGYNFNEAKEDDAGMLYSEEGAYDPLPPKTPPPSSNSKIARALVNSLAFLVIFMIFSAPISIPLFTNIASNTKICGHFLKPLLATSVFFLVSYLASCIKIEKKSFYN